VPERTRRRRVSECLNALLSRQRTSEASEFGGEAGIRAESRCAAGAPRDGLKRWRTANEASKELAVRQGFEPRDT